MTPRDGADLQLDIIIPTRERAATAVEAVRYLREELGWKHRIIVVGPDSSGQQAQRLSESASNVDYVVDRGAGPGAARNTAFSETNAPWVLFLDDDVRPGHDYLERCNGYLQQHDWVDCLHPSVRPKTEWSAYLKDPATWRTSYDKRDKARPTYSPHLDALYLLTSSPNSSFEALTIGVSSGNMIVSRRAFLGVGGFDENVDGPGDDREFGFRLWWYGYRTLYFPDAFAFHLHDESGGLRRSGSRLKNLLTPEPAPSWIYVHMKWFPGAPYRAFRNRLLLRSLRKGPKAPIKIMRMRRAIKIARARLDSGPIYLTPPQTRDDALGERLS